ncbi:hypothetical protein K7711_11680 [Nocardia sp. CA2R105]|uniref:hypothetical protein n=1 Tax=Nocardia coffeae TaxID=2873381 RepID=UPI001CA741F4|nr:hypothetical protein [Nocardia coffeae]MBY8857140.1 hypothetical protein [Nocardia coffeae]
MDRLHEELLATVLDPASDHGITTAVDLTLIGRYHERFADNAVEVGRRTIFLATGKTADEWNPTHRTDEDRQPALHRACEQQLDRPGGCDRPSASRQLAKQAPQQRFTWLTRAMRSCPRAQLPGATAEW